MPDLQTLLWIGSSCLFALIGLLVVQVLGSGILKKLRLERTKLGPYVFLYETFQGPYRNVGPVFDQLVRKIADSNLVEEEQKVTTVGFYFDDPAKVDGSQCRSSICCMMHDGSEGLLERKSELEKHELVKSGALQVGVFPESECISVEFPFYSRWSIFMGVMRCYPVLQKAVDALTSKEQENVLGSMEVYCCHDQYMLFTFPLTARKDLLPFDVKKTA